jgi:hypothetical protein
MTQSITNQMITDKTLSTENNSIILFDLRKEANLAIVIS